MIGGILNALSIGVQCILSYFNKLIMVFGKIISKGFGKIYIEDRSVTVKSISFATLSV